MFFVPASFIFWGSLAVTRDEVVFIPFFFGRWWESWSACSPKSGLLFDWPSTKIHLSYRYIMVPDDGWFGCTMVRCLLNFVIGPAVKLNQDPHKSQFGFVSRKVRSPASAYTCLLHGMKMSFLCKSKNGKGQHSPYFSRYSLSRPFLLGA